MIRNTVEDDHKVIYMVINMTTGVNHVVVKYKDVTRKSISIDLPFTSGTNLITYSNNLLECFN